MRDPNRLYGFYNELTRVHIEHFPDWRFGQLMNNFLGWVQVKKEKDFFYIEENKMLDLLHEYVQYIKGE